jgi:hypothetical protein
MFYLTLALKQKLARKLIQNGKNHKSQKKFSFCALIGILPMAQNRPIPLHQIAEKNCMPIQAAAARSPSSPPLLLLSTLPPSPMQLHWPLAH